MQNVAVTAAGLSVGAGLVAGGVAYASRWPTSQLFGRTVVAGSAPSEIALTYDDGPNPSCTPQLLELLAKHQVRATFFLIGNFVRREKQLVRELAGSGHLIGNHTISHPNLALQSAASIRRELSDCSKLLEDTTGTAVSLFRPPFGSRRPAVLRIARELNLAPVLWNVTGHDWDPIGASRILANVEDGIARNGRRGRGSNLLLHDGGHLEPSAARLDTVAATARLLAAHRNDSTRWVTIDAWVQRAHIANPNFSRE